MALAGLESYSWTIDDVAKAFTDVGVLRLVCGGFRSMGSSCITRKPRPRARAPSNDLVQGDNGVQNAFLFRKARSRPETTNASGVTHSWQSFRSQPT